MNMKSQILKFIAFAFVVFSLSFMFPEVSYAATTVVITKDKTSGEFTVPATDKSGVVLKNQTGKEVTVFLKASGEWSIFPKGKLVGPGGDQNIETRVKFPQFVPSSLVAINEGRGESQIGTQGAISIGNDGNAVFLINDSPTEYEDNRGEVQVVWSDHAQ